MEIHWPVLICMLIVFLFQIYFQEGKKLIALQPSAFIVGNMVRRLLKIIREECARLQGLSEESAGKESLHHMLTSERSGT